MATIKLTIFKAKILKDGKHKIRIAICHKQETCYIVTRFIIDSLSQFKNGQVVKREDANIINAKLRNLLNEYQNRLDSINNQSLYSCTQLKNMISETSKQNETLSYQSVCNDFLDELKRDERISYAVLIERSCRYFTEFTKGEIPLPDITIFIIENFAKYLHTKKKIGNTTIGMMLSQIKAVINRAISSGRVKYDIHPFKTIRIAKSLIREADISLNSLNSIKNSKPTLRKLVVARDIFMLSFYLGGINLIDMLNVSIR